MSNRELIEKIEARIGEQRDNLECWSASQLVTQLLTSEIAFLESILTIIQSKD